jgi:hypothetical protein
MFAKQGDGGQKKWKQWAKTARYYIVLIKRDSWDSEWVFISVNSKRLENNIQSLHTKLGWNKKMFATTCEGGVLCIKNSTKMEGCDL